MQRWLCLLSKVFRKHRRPALQNVQAWQLALYFITFENKKVLVEALYFHLKTSLVDDLALDGKIENEEQIVSLWHKVIIWGLDNPDKMAFFSIYYSSPWVESSFKHNVL